MMDRLKSNKGGTLIEMIILLTVILSLSLLWIRPNHLIDASTKKFISSMIHTQFMALYLKEEINYTTDTITNYPIRFNSNGNVNMSQTISFGNKKVIIMLGTGRIHEKRIFND